MSEQELVSCSSAGDCNGGYLGETFYNLKKTGVTGESCFRYTATNSYCKECSKEYKLDTYTWNWQPDRETIKTSLRTKGPLVVGLWMAGYFNSQGEYVCNGRTGGAHAIVLVGYNDIQGHWIAKNSWGSNWMNKGYFNIAYGQCGIEDEIYMLEGVRKI
jgi:C1A family cysteine protease